MKIILIILLYFFFGTLFSALFKVYVFDGHKEAGENATLAGILWVVTVPIIVIILLWFIPYAALSEYLTKLKNKPKKVKELKEVQNNYQTIK